MQVLRGKRAQNGARQNQSCLVAGCAKPVMCVQLCSVHYKRHRRYGDPNVQRHASPGMGHFPAEGYAHVVLGGKLRLYHRVVAARALGRQLPPGCEVHHFDGNPANQAADNLVICPDRAYHMLLHRRQRALDACGHANWRKCAKCKSWDDPSRLTICATAAYHNKRYPCP
jgi:hypothetical protein